MSDNIQDISTTSENGVKSVERLTLSIDKMKKSLNDIDSENIESMAETMEVLNKTFNDHKILLEDVIKAYGTLKEGFGELNEQREENTEKANESTNEEMESLSELFGMCSSEFSSISKAAEGNNAAIIGSIGLVSKLFSAAMQVGTGISDMIVNWDKMSDMERGIGIMKIAAAAAIGLASAIALAKAVGTSGVIGLIAGGAIIAATIVAFTTSTQKATDSIKNHADGGGFNTADLFYANENGNVELIASSNNGGGAVMNMEQLRSAVYDGVYAAITSGGNNSSGIVMIDGVKAGKLVARSVYDEGKRVGYWR